METPENGWYYVDKEGKQQGPLNRAALIALHSGGGIDHDTLIWAAGSDCWKGFSSVFTEQIPPPTPLSLSDPNPPSIPPPIPSPSKAPSGTFPSAHTKYYKRPEGADSDTHAPSKAPAPAVLKQTDFLRAAPKSEREEHGKFVRIYAIFAHVLALIFTGTLIVLFERARAPSLMGIVGHLTAGAGFIIPALVFGSFGLLNKYARFPTFVALSWIVFYLQVQGTLPK